MANAPRIVEVRERVLKHNDLLARELRRQFTNAGVQVVSLVSSPGAGKTTLLELLLTRLQRDYSVAALVGDLATENDAARLQRSGAPVRQITTGTICHLDAAMVSSALSGWMLRDFDMIFIENVGNLVCPSSYDLGESLRAVVLSVTEGEDKPLKYPTIFNSADIAIITKMDLAEAVDFNLESVRNNISSVRPDMPVFPVSAKSGLGVEILLNRLSHRERRAPRSASPTGQSLKERAG